MVNVRELTRLDAWSAGLGGLGVVAAGSGGANPAVRKLQVLLNRAGFTDDDGRRLTEDGGLGPRTRAAIRKAERAFGMPETGTLTLALENLLKARVGDVRLGEDPGGRLGRITHRTQGTTQEAVRQAEERVPVPAPEPAPAAQPRLPRWASYDWVSYELRPPRVPVEQGVLDRALAFLRRYWYVAVPVAALGVLGTGVAVAKARRKRPGLSGVRTCARRRP
jgi:peptidoglycan hydrolase-like protein with peptidoglycan-binding domain